MAMLKVINPCPRSPNKSRLSGTLSRILISVSIGVGSSTISRRKKESKGPLLRKLLMGFGGEPGGSKKYKGSLSSEDFSLGNLKLITPFSCQKRVFFLIT